ncbi:MAG: hypothetical protein ACOC5T_09575, partial [Elusimicrobiota bacterium]
MDYEDSDDFLNDLDPEEINAIFSECDKELPSSVEIDLERINSLFKRVYICLFHPKLSLHDGLSYLQKSMNDFTDSEKAYLLAILLG